MFDLTSLDTRTRAEAGADMPVLNPKTGQPFRKEDGTPVVITLKGRNSKAFKDLQAEIARRRADLEARGITPDSEHFETARYDLLCAMTVGWNIDTLDGQPFPYSPENAAKMWADGRWAWLAGDAFTFVQGEGNFLGI